MVNDFNSALLWGDWENLDLSRRVEDRNAFRDAISTGLDGVTPPITEAVNSMATALKSSIDPMGAKLDSINSAIDSMASDLANKMDEIVSAVGNIESTSQQHPTPDHRRQWRRVKPAAATSVTLEPSASRPPLGWVRTTGSTVLAVGSRLAPCTTRVASFLPV